MSQEDVSFSVTRTQRQLVVKIAKRAVRVAREACRIKLDNVSTQMDLCATHANGNPLRFADLLAADDFNLLHDVLGIRRHLNRDTGELMNCFRPRFSVPASKCAA